MNFAGPPAPQPRRRGLLGKLERGLTRLASEVEASIAAQTAQRMAAINQQAATAHTNPPLYTPSPAALPAATPTLPQALELPAHTRISSSTVVSDMEGIYEPDLSGPATREMGTGLGRKADQLKERIAQLEAEGASPERIAYLRLELAKTLTQANVWMQSYAASGHATQNHFGMMMQGQIFLHNSTMQGLQGLNGSWGTPSSLGSSSSYGTGSYYNTGTYYGNGTYYGDGSNKYQYSY